MGTKGLRFKEPSIYGPDLSWAGLSRALQKAIDGDGSASRSPQQECHSTDTTVCSATPAWTSTAGHTRRCSSDWNSASSRHTCKAPQKPGRPTSASTGQACQPAQNAQRPGSADADHPGSSRSIDSLLLGPWPSSTDRRQRTDAHRRRPYLDLHLQLRQVSHGCVLGRTAQRGTAFAG